MKLAILLPGYVESPDYLHLKTIDTVLSRHDYTVIRVDPCDLWSSGNVSWYTTTNYINQVKKIINSYLTKEPTEIVLIGHSLGSLVALIVGNMFSEISQIICLSPPISLDNSDHKWVNGIRTSRKDLPENPLEYREFSIPFSFAIDRKQYSIINSFKNNKKDLMIIMGEQDPSTIEYEKLKNILNTTKFTVIPGMNHDFRQSEELCHQVTDTIERFVN